MLYSTLSVLRHQTYHSFGFDLGLYDQVFWNTTQGRILESTMATANPIPHSQMSDHFSPIYLLLTPIYFLHPQPETLLVLQTGAIALGAWPVYLLARLKLPAGYAVLWVLVYVLFVPVAFINLYDFHEIAFAIAPLGFALYFLERGRGLWFVVCILFTFLIKEEMGLVAVGFGAYVLLGKRDWRLGLGVATAGLATFALLIGVVIPHFVSGGYIFFGLRYAEVGGSPLGVIRTALTNPMHIIRALIVAKKFYFVIGIFGPVLGLSMIAGWAAILVLPTLSYTLLSGYEPQYSFTSQYSAPLIPLVIGTSIIALARLPKRFRSRIAAAVAASTLVFSWAYGDLPYSRKFDWSLFQTPARYGTFLPSLSDIPPDARVSAENGLTSHLNHRRYIYDYWYEGIQDAEWVVLDYEGTGYNIELFDEQVAQVKARGYVEVASGYGLSLLRKS